VLNLLKDKLTIFNEGAFEIYTHLFEEFLKLGNAEVVAEYLSVLSRFKVTYETELLLINFCQQRIDKLAGLVTL